MSLIEQPSVTPPRRPARKLMALPRSQPAARPSQTPPHVHRFEGREHVAINDFLSNDSRNSALICGDTKKVLSRMACGIFQTCITSPPYWSLRDYGIPGQIGLEDSVFQYVEHLTGVFAQVRRVMREDGTLWLNIGDSYTSGGRTWRAA